FPLMAKVIAKVSHALNFLNLDRTTLAIVSLSVLVWLIEGMMFVIAPMAFGLELNLAMGYFALAVVNFGLLVPSSPAYIGVFQGMAVLALGLFGISNEVALSVSILVHASQFLPITLAGLVIYLYESLHSGHQEP
ncbi:MAG: flippase-like domain-containing protein, partial [Fidelibacterota bacterium]